jgi:hypothetical protein
MFWCTFKPLNIYFQPMGHKILRQFSIEYPTLRSLSMSAVLLLYPTLRTWSYSDWSDVVLHHLQELSITHVLINGGLWRNKWSDTIEQQSFMKALEATNMTGIWRTTTYNSERVLREPDTNDAMVKLFTERASGNTAVLDVSWTKDMITSFYWDGMHFSDDACIKSFVKISCSKCCTINSQSTMSTLFD